jgi:hypothetical protein
VEERHLRSDEVEKSAAHVQRGLTGWLLYLTVVVQYQLCRLKCPDVNLYFPPTVFAAEGILIPPTLFQQLDIRALGLYILQRTRGLCLIAAGVSPILT